MISKKRVCVYTHLAQDVDLAIPIANGLQQSGIEAFVYIDEKLICDSPRALSKLKAGGVRVVRHPLRSFGQRIVRKLYPSWIWQPKCDALLAIVESNLGPHRRGREQALHAKKRGIPTFTYQHGIDNIGLTYSDSEYPIQTVNFVSDRVWIWGDVSSLHPETPEETRSKVYSVGCVKNSDDGERFEISALSAYSEVIGVFENLHWKRYSGEYASNFVECLSRLAIEFPNKAFLVKPHHAGRWLTDKSSLLKRLEHANIYILDPRDPKWEPFTAPAVIRICDKVISTPSTVILDACLKNKMVAVVADTSTLPNYRGIQTLQEYKDWREFVERPVSIGVLNDFLARNSVDRNGSVTRAMSMDVCRILNSNVSKTTD